MKRLKTIFCMIIFFLPQIIFAQDLSINSNDIVIEQSIDGGYLLWIRKKEGMESVLLTESTEDPDHKDASYSYRAIKYNKYNGDEKRMLNGEFLTSESSKYSLIDSTAEVHPELGDAFKIFIPYVIVFGYPWSRSGELLVVDGTYLSIRAFDKKYADYSGGYKDNPFVLRVFQGPLEGSPDDNYMDDTVKTYKEIAKEGGGRAIYCKGEEDLLNAIKDILNGIGTKSLDLVLALDTTSSMENDIPWLKKELVPLLKKQTAGFDHFQFGLVLYRDYHDEYVTKTRPFQSSFAGIQDIINNIKVFGGRDIPEAVHEALYEGIHEYTWTAQDCKLILIGDAPPHERPRGKITKEMVYNDAKKAGIEIITVILPQ